MEQPKKLSLAFAKKEEAGEILAIYTPYVKETAITFELIPPSQEEMEKRIVSYGENHPFLVLKEENEIIGYAYGSPYYGRAAYQYTCEASIYLKKERQGEGLGAVLYFALFALLKEQGYFRIYGAITGENKKSIAFHESFGFHEIGFFAQCGYKFSSWHDVVWLEMVLQEGGNPEDSPKKTKTIPKDQVENIFHEAINLVKFKKKCT